MKKIKIEDAPRQEEIVWKEILRSRESRYDHRLHGILFVCRGLSSYDAAAVWGRSPRAVEYWVKRFNKSGLNGLWEKPKAGRPSVLNGGVRERLREEIRQIPRAMGYAGRRWTGELLQSHIEKNYRVRMSVRQCQRLLSGGLSMA